MFKDKSSNNGKSPRALEFIGIIEGSQFLDNILRKVWGIKLRTIVL